MKIHKDMDLNELAQMMGEGASAESAKLMSEMLQDYAYVSDDLEDIEWTMLRDYAIRASARRVTVGGD